MVGSGISWGCTSLALANCSRCCEAVHIAALQSDHHAGLPPTWARRKDAVGVLERMHEERFGADFGAMDAPTYRRKFIWKTSAWDIATNPRRPPFHGSFSRKRWTHALLVRQDRPGMIVFDADDKC